LLLACDKNVTASESEAEENGLAHDQEQNQNNQQNNYEIN